MSKGTMILHVVAVAVAAVLVVTGLRAPAGEQSSTRARAVAARAVRTSVAPPPPSPSPAPDPATAIDRTIDSIAAAAAKLPRDSFDPRAVAQQVGTDPAALFTWVRDFTHFVPYRGSLRGPVGVLMDRMGNSLDRALLLAELYRIAVFPPA